MGAEDLISNGKEVAVIENHNGDGFTNSYSNTRNSYNAITGYPTTVFDGLTKHIGGNHTTSLYPTFLNYYNNRIGIQSDFTIQMWASNSGLDYNLHVVVNRVSSNTTDDLRLIPCITQSNIAFNWQGQNHVSHVNRLMIPHGYGYAIDFGSGNTAVFDIPFTIDGSWPLSDLELVVFVQGFAGKEIFQGVKKPLSLVGINEQPVSNNFNLNIYPNPLSNTAMIAFDLKESSDAMVEVYDIIGKNVYSNFLGTVPAGVNTVDFDGSNLDAGMYIIKLTVNNQTVTKKINITK